MDDIDRIIGEQDHVLRSNSFEQFKHQLGKLWEMRTQREDEYAEFVNMLQMLFIDRDVNHFSDAQLRAVKETLNEAFLEDEFDDQLNNELTERLIRGGLDVFRELD